MSKTAEITLESEITKEWLESVLPKRETSEEISGYLDKLFDKSIKISQVGHLLVASDKTLDKLLALNFPSLLLDLLKKAAEKLKGEQEQKDEPASVKRQKREPSAVDSVQGMFQIKPGSKELSDSMLKFSDKDLTKGWHDLPFPSLTASSNRFSLDEDDCFEYLGRRQMFSSFTEAVQKLQSEKKKRVLGPKPSPTKQRSPRMRKLRLTGIKGSGKSHVAAAFAVQCHKGIVCGPPHRRVMRHVVFLPNSASACAAPVQQLVQALLLTFAQAGATTKAPDATGQLHDVRFSDLTAKISQLQTAEDVIKFCVNNTAAPLTPPLILVGDNWNEVLERKDGAEGDPKYPAAVDLFVQAFQPHVVVEVMSSKNERSMDQQNEQNVIHLRFNNGLDEVEFKEWFQRRQEQQRLPVDQSDSKDGSQAKCNKKATTNVKSGAESSAKHTNLDFLKDMTGRLPLLLELLCTEFVARRDSTPTQKDSTAETVKGPLLSSDYLAGLVNSTGKEVDGPLTFQRLVDIARNSDHVRTMVSNVINFVDETAIAKGEKAFAKLLRFLKAAVHCYGAVDIQKGYDHRYFFLTESGQDAIPAASCGWVREVARSLLFEHDENSHKELVDQFAAYIKAAPNPSARGFAIEAAVLAHIRFNGLRCWEDDPVDKNGDPVKDRKGKVVKGEKVDFKLVLGCKKGPRYIVFQNGEEASLGTQRDSTIMYVPRAWNYEAVDCVIRQHSSKDKVVRVVGVQITMMRDPEVSHKVSVDKFFRNVKARWANDLAHDVAAGFEIQYIWIWVEKDGDEVARKSLGLCTTKIGKDTRHKKAERVTYSVFKVTLGDISEALQSTVAECYKRDEELHRV